jgi:hypothetical protein
VDPYIYSPLRLHGVVLVLVTLPLRNENSKSNVLKSARNPLKREIGPTYLHDALSARYGGGGQAGAPAHPKFKQKIKTEIRKERPKH